MNRIGLKLCLMTALIAVFCVITQTAFAAVAPQFEWLGRMEGLADPARVDVDSEGNFYVVEMSARRVVKYDKYGIMLTEMVDDRITGAGLAVTDDGATIFVSAGDGVLVYDSLGNIQAEVGQVAAAGFVAWAPIGRLFVADMDNRVVNVYDTADYSLSFQVTADGKNGSVPFKSITSLGYYSPPDPTDIPNTRLYVGDSIYPVMLHSYTADGAHAQSVDCSEEIESGGGTSGGYWGRNGWVEPVEDPVVISYNFGDSRMLFVGGWAFDDAGRGYVLDQMQNEIRVFTAPGTMDYLSLYNSVGSYDDGDFIRPIDTAYDAVTKRLFVVASGGRVEIIGIDDGQTPVIANEVPGVPTIVAPAGGVEVTTADPVLEFISGGDADGDALAYEVEIDGVVSTTDALSVSMAGLEENEDYSWRVRAHDGREYSEWTAYETFTVNAIDEAPSAPVLGSLLAGSVVEGDSVFNWSASVDLDPGDDVSYRYEIATGSDFTNIVASELLLETSIILGGLAEYLLLDDGSTYWYRVWAVDSDGLATSSGSDWFVYDTAMIVIEATMPGALVHRADTESDFGPAIAAVPCELRDVSLGVSRYVVTKPGFESQLITLLVSEGENVSVKAQLEPAIVPADYKFAPVSAGGEKLTVGADASIAFADMNFDGQADMVVGDSSGTILLALANPDVEGGFDLPQQIFVTGKAGVSVALADVDGNFTYDLVLGFSDGSVEQAYNDGTIWQSRFTGMSSVTANGSVVMGDVSAVPALGDMSGDGIKDLLVGYGSGELIAYLGTESGYAEGVVYLTIAGSRVSPVFADIDADGELELVVADSERMYVYEVSPSGPEQVAVIGADGVVEKNGSKPFSGKGASSFGSGIQPFVIDLDGKGGKDIVIGNSSGDIRVGSSHGTEVFAAIIPSLIEKSDELKLLADGDLEMIGVLDAVDVSIQAGDYIGAATELETLLTEEGQHPGVHELYDVLKAIK